MGINSFLKSRYPLYAWIIVIGILCFTPGSEFKEVKINIPHFDKVVHFGMFFILGLFISLSQATKPYSWLIFSILYGGIIEFIQDNYIHLRSGDLWDWLADAIGLFSGYLLYKFYLKRKSPDKPDFN